MSGFSPSIDELRASVDRELEGFLLERKRSVPEAAPLIDEVERLLGAGGKRLRPAFCYWGFRSVGGKLCDEIVRAAGSLELLHTFAIVHDDIMDAAGERRGVPTTHSLHDAAFALLVGDFALVIADELLMTSGFDSEIIANAFGSYSIMRQEVIAGQHLDAAAAAVPSMTVEEARRIAVLKSGRYSIEKPLMIGATLAGASEDVVRGLARFGDPLGEAFQLRDDLLGTFGDPASTGKSVDSDIREGKRNVLFALSAEALEGPDAEFFVTRWGAGADLSDDEVSRLRELIEETGARRAAERLLDERSNVAAVALGTLPLSGATRAALTELARLATDRTF